MPRHLRQTSLAFFLAAILSWQLQAAEQSEPTISIEEPGNFLCKPIAPLFPPRTEETAKAVAGKGTQIQADKAVSKAEKITHFSGDVIIEQTDKRLAADAAEYDHTSEVLSVSGKVRYEDDALQLIGERGRFDLGKNQGEIYNVDYRMLPRHASGHAESMRLESEQRLQLQQATYTTCDLDDVDWLFSASEIILDNSIRQGTAKHVVLRFQQVPFLYFPYLRFPLGEERLSGFLFPGFGNSDRHGVEVSIPYYWNIAPNYDATITPVFLKKRGTRLDTELRYLGQKQQGVFDLQYLPNDKEAGDLNRQYYHLVHSSAPATGWNTNIDWQRVGDVKFFEDFGGGLDSTSLTHLERHAQANYNRPLWSLTFAGQDYQPLSGIQPYQRLPQIRFQSQLPEMDNKLHYALEVEWVRFNHDDANMVTGDRLSAAPSISLPLQNDAMFLIPKLALKGTQYQLEQDYNGSREPSVTLPVFSLDSGLFLERDTRLGGVNLLHTLEPRLFYAYVPYRDQSQLPVFDTSLTTASLFTLFSDNRFTGVDRYGDTNHITASLTTRLLRQDTGSELFSASVGQQFILDERQVTLAGNVLDTDNRSSLFAELHLRPDEHWQFDSEIQWQTDLQETEMGASQLQYRLDQDRMLRLAHRFRRDTLETREAALFWRLTPRWHFFASDRFDLREEHRLETFYGLQYDSCCWTLRVMARQYFTGLSPIDNQPEYDDAVYFELGLKGLSSFGRRGDIDTFMTTAGYH